MDPLSGEMCRLRTDPAGTESGQRGDSAGGVTCRRPPAHGEQSDGNGEPGISCQYLPYFLALHR